MRLLHFRQAGGGLGLGVCVCVWKAGRTRSQRLVRPVQPAVRVHGALLLRQGGSDAACWLHAVWGWAHVVCGERWHVRPLAAQPRWRGRCRECPYVTFPACRSRQTGPRRCGLLLRRCVWWPQHAVLPCLTCPAPLSPFFTTPLAHPPRKCDTSTHARVHPCT